MRTSVITSARLRAVAAALFLFSAAARAQDAPPREEGKFRKPDLVELTKIDPTIKLDVRYATPNNFLGRRK